MSIFFEFDVGPSGRRFRRAVDGDKSDVELLLDGSEQQLFGSVDIGTLIEVCTLPICLITAKHEVAGFMALADRPNVPGVHPAHWEMWMRNLFQKFYLARNTLFVHFMCCTAETRPFFLEEALASVFRNDSYISQIVLMVPTSCPKDCLYKYETIKKHRLAKFHAKNGEDVTCAYYFYAARRREFCPKLKIRRAVEEDNDDIVAILDQKCPRLRQLYGDFYVSEIVGRRPQTTREVIVAECQSVAVGVMCLNSEINYQMLQKTYELEPYHGLTKTSAFEKERNKRNNNLLKTFGEPIMLGRWSPFEQLPKCETASVEDEPSKEKLVEPKPPKPKALSKVNFDRDAARLSGSLRHSSEELTDQVLGGGGARQSTVLDLLEEEPFDYEIVNIDKTLFAVPEVLSSNSLVYPRNTDSRHSRSYQIERNVKRIISSYKKPSPPEPAPQGYEGDPDAFMIELFGFREDIDERQGYDLLEAAFEVMKDYDYCIIRVPCVEKSFPLLQHFCFVPYKQGVCSKYALYVAHRNSVAGKLRVRRAELSDIPQIAGLLQRLDGRETVWTVEDTVLRRNRLQAYVFLSGVSLVGVGIVEPPEHIDYIRAKFDMDSYHIHKYHYSGRGSPGFVTLRAALVYPAFEPHYRFFIRDMMRQSDVTCMIWLTGYRNKWVIHKINSLAQAMIPLLPRKFELEYENIEELKNIVELSKSLTSFSAWFISNGLTSVPRVNVDTRIVVVGASTTGMSFINKLLFRDTSPYIFFTNVTLISRHGLPYTRRKGGEGMFLRRQTATDRDTSPYMFFTNVTLISRHGLPYTRRSKGGEGMFLRRQTATDRYLKSVPYTYYVNVIKGTMVEINKKEKFVKLANDSKCYYDILFLMIGKQYQHPGYLRSALDRERSIRLGTFQYTRLDNPEHHQTLVCSDDPPENVFIINCLADANRALKYVSVLQSCTTDYKIIVYGASIHAYCCLATLLEAKVPGENIIFVEPFPPQNPAKTRVSLFCNDYVDNTVMKMLASLKVQVYRSYYFHTWSVDVANIATEVAFLSHFKLITLECDALFYYGKRSVDEQALIAMNKSGMAYDGGIVIDHEFRTQDPAIYAAGPATKYNRRYCADGRRHKYYDSTEVGEKLGAQIRNQLDPLFTEVKETSRKQSVRFSLKENIPECSNNDVKDSLCQDEESINRKTSVDYDLSSQLPELSNPRVTRCALPGGLQYLEVRPPASKIPHHYVQSLDYTGHVMETFKTGYFKLHFTNDLIVDGVTCLTPEKFSLDIFKHLYGMCAVVLNNVHLRYSAKKLDDFFEFFRAPWAVFLYHDRRDELFAMVKELLPKGNHQGETLRDGLRAAARKLSASEPFTAHTKLSIRSSYEKSPHVAAVADYVLEWLSHNDVLLPMYLPPPAARDLEHNPAFRRRKRKLTRLLSAIY